MGHGHWQDVIDVTRSLKRQHKHLANLQHTVDGMVRELECFRERISGGQGTSSAPRRKSTKSRKGVQINAGFHRQPSEDVSDDSMLQLEGAGAPSSDSASSVKSEKTEGFVLHCQSAGIASDSRGERSVVSKANAPMELRRSAARKREVDDTCLEGGPASSMPF